MKTRSSGIVGLAAPLQLLSAVLYVVLAMSSQYRDVRQKTCREVKTMLKEVVKLVSVDIWVSHLFCTLIQASKMEA